MARLRIEMYKLREILRLKYECGLSDRQVAKGCAVSRRTVGIYWKQAQAAGLDWAVAKGLADTGLEQAVWGRDRPGSRGTNTLPDFHYIYRELKRPHVTLELLWQEYREENPNGCGYSWFQERYSKWRKNLNIWLRQEHRAGEKIQTQLFVGVWGASNYTYAEASLGQKKEAWVMAQVHLFEYSGAVPRLVVPDNLKSGVTKACRYEYAEWKKARVNIDYHIEIERHCYSVPYQLVHEQGDVRLTGHVIEVFYKNRRTTSHARSGVRGGYATKLEHLPPAHRKHLAWTPERMIDWPGKTGESTKEVVTTIITSKKHPALAYRSCLGILRLGRCYGKARIENAARRALKFRTGSYQNMKAILAHGLDKQTDLFPGPVNLVSPVHENIRGQEYYRKSDGQPQ